MKLTTLYRKVFDHTMSRIKKELYHTEWLSLWSVADKPRGYENYIYSHETRCNGKIISVLPFRFNENDKLEFLLRDEFTPAWSGVDTIISSITGGYESDLGLMGTAIEEMNEEAGYIVRENEIIPLGWSYGSKSSDTKYYLYSVDLTNKIKETSASGDGSILEAEATCFWSSDISLARDPWVYVIYAKLMEYLSQEITHD